ncbi:glyoxylate/hydroxypyruvate reductase A [Aquiflexum balticum DSM 16537]|uniref:Glyoxylate/hydroxypyruvate reductase A n=1 Tax=Aquiflexum balticum DSM 16537 TaxID=758820 RepID=A0A1W2H6U3_9BACT|nr:glyoxylate/hydroxypyruvate reductase A [Aquiflexum balticum]SMD44677.1 glyoxylate/hydroxypyruvate reductase A [Aquiflexum balticum DSM 16537]
MGIAIISPGREVKKWKENFYVLDKSIRVQVYPEISDKEAVEAVLLWQHPKGILNQFPNLKLICSMGAGVDHILSDQSIPSHIPIVRIVDEKLTYSMTNYALMGILNYHRQIFRYQLNQKKKIWDMSNPEIDIHVGVMGVGALGGDLVDKLLYMGIPVSGYGNSPKSGLNFPYYFGDQLNDFLAQVNVIVCMLPLTPQTENILNISLFENCNKGTYLINVARGRHLVEEDLLEALDKGYLSGALLDVYRKEPLPKDHPFWERNEITITPHIASVTNPDAAAPQIIDNYKRLKNSQPLINQINLTLGY